MYTNEQINRIISELGLDPNDSSVRKTIEQILALKPEVPIDQNFIDSLREDLATRANMHNAHLDSNSNQIKTNFFSSFMNRVLAGALIVMVVVAGSGLWYIQQTNKPLFKTNLGASEQLLSSKFAVKDATAESFGDLSKVSIIPAAQNASLKTAPMANGMGGANLGNSVESAPQPSDIPTDKMIAPGEPYPVATQYVFNYAGSALPQLPDMEGVLKRSKPIQPPGLVSRIVSFLSFGLVDLSKLTNASLDSVNFSEDKDFGYQASVDLTQGNVYFNKNWEKWPQNPNNCFEAACPMLDSMPVRLKDTDLPSDQEAISIAEQFITDYGINKESYGSPVINDQWRVQYMNAPVTERATWYIPEEVQVIYPLLLDGKEIIDESGNVYGMSMYIDARTKKVSSVSDLVTKQFERSSYKGETDTEKIIKIAKNGGFRNASYNDPNAKKVQLDLGTPTIETVKMWYSPDNYKTNSELYVPALVFPIKNWKENNYWRQNIYVPLVQDILDSDNQPVPIPLDVKLPANEITVPPTTNGAAE